MASSRAAYAARVSGVYTCMSLSEHNALPSEYVFWKKKVQMSLALVFIVDYLNTYVVKTCAKVSSKEREDVSTCNSISDCSKIQRRSLCLALEAFLSLYSFFSFIALLPFNPFFTLHSLHPFFALFTFHAFISFKKIHASGCFRKKFWIVFQLLNPHFKCMN